MIDIWNLRLEEHGEWTRLIANIRSDFERKDTEQHMWFAVKKQNARFLTCDVYNMFLFYPLYMSMYYKSDLHLHGKVSELLYNNINNYLMPIMSTFSDDLKPINILTDGFEEAARDNLQLVGTGLSGGVDCLATIYTHYKEEKCQENKINALFMTNFATDKDVNERKLFNERCSDMRRIADALDLPFYEIDTNLDSFLDLGDRNSYFALYSCAFALEKVLSKYYISSSLSYGEILKWNHKSRNKDWSEFADPYAIPLMQSKNLHLISDGCQYTRTEKTELISDWDIAQKYLYVCSGKKSIVNCCECIKCRRTLLPLDAMGKLDKFSDVFDIDKYRKNAFGYKCQLVVANNREVFATDNYLYCKKHGMKLPAWIVARLYTLPKAVKYHLHR